MGGLYRNGAQALQTKSAVAFRPCSDRNSSLTRGLVRKGAQIPGDGVQFVLSQRARKETDPMTDRPTSVDFVTAFATGWPEREPHLLVLSLTTHKGVQDFAMTREQALLIAKTIKRTAAQLAEPKQVG
jgi:hypothetical protein